MSVVDNQSADTRRRNAEQRRKNTKYKKVMRATPPFYHLNIEIKKTNDITT